MRCCELVAALGAPGAAVDRKVSVIMINKKSSRALDEDQVRELLARARGTPYEALWIVELAAGLRLGELLGLKWSDLDWDTRQVTIQRQLRLPLKSAEPIFTELKTRSAPRALCLDAAVMDALREHQARQQESQEWQADGVIFPAGAGQPYEPDALRRWLEDWSQAHGLPEIHFQDLRQTALARARGMASE